MEMEVVLGKLELLRKIIGLVEIELNSLPPTLELLTREPYEQGIANGAFGFAQSLMDQLQEEQLRILKEAGRTKALEYPVQVFKKGRSGGY